MTEWQQRRAEREVEEAERVRKWKEAQDALTAISLQRKAEVAAAHPGVRICATCRYSEVHSPCSEPPGFYCLRAGSSDGEAASEGTLAVAQDAEGYHAHLDVNLMFGCVQWEAAE